MSGQPKTASDSNEASHPPYGHAGGHQQGYPAQAWHGFPAQPNSQQAPPYAGGAHPLPGQPDYASDGTPQWAGPVEGRPVGDDGAAMAVGPPFAPPPLPDVEGSNAKVLRNRFPPAAWLYPEHWRRMYLYTLVGMDSETRGGEDNAQRVDFGVYQCQMPRGPDKPVCGDVIRDRFASGADLESHAASFHGVSKLPPAFGPRTRRRPWSSSLFGCLDDPASCLDCLACPLCFIGRMEKIASTGIRWEKGVTPYTTEYRNRSSGVTDECCEVCVGFTIFLPVIAAFFPLTCCGFIDTSEDSWVCCVSFDSPLFIRNANNLSESVCCTKLKMLMCCPLVACQTYREMRHAGVNPGLTCSARDEADEAAWAAAVARAWSEPTALPTRSAILAANGGGHPSMAGLVGMSAPVPAGAWNPHAPPGSVEMQ